MKRWCWFVAGHFVIGLPVDHEYDLHLYSKSITLYVDESCEIFGEAKSQKQQQISK